MNSRRDLLKVAAAGAAAVGPLAAAPKVRTPFTESDKVDVGATGSAMIERARSLGGDYYSKYGNCAQCTIAALQDSIDFAPKDEVLFLAGTPLAGGATATGNASCGAFTGAGIVIGSVCGRSRDEFGDRQSAALAGKLMREVTAKFEETYGSVLCKDVKSKVEGKCRVVVERGSQWAAEAILKQFGKA